MFRYRFGLRDAGRSDRAGSCVDFEIEGRVILLTDWRRRGPMGKAKAQLDGQCERSSPTDTAAGTRYQSDFARE